MSSFKSHFRHHPQQPPSSTLPPPAQSSRIPTKPASAEGGKPAKAAQHVNKLAKRSTRNVTAPEPSVKSSTTRTGTPMTAAAYPSRRPSVTPSGTTLPTAPPDMRTPSLVSGSSVSTSGSPMSALRRKPSGAIDRHAAQKRAATTGRIDNDRSAMQSRNEFSREVLDDTVLGVSFPSVPACGLDASAGSTQYSYDRSVTRDFTPPVFNSYAPSSTPSTRYTDSPFSHELTPSSASSYSPSVVATTGGVSRQRQSSSPTRNRPPLSGRRPSKDEALKVGLFPVRESSTSSSSSTVRPDARLPRVNKTQHPGLLDAKTTGVRSPSSTNRPAKEQSQSSPAKGAAQAPPELAHLNVDLAPRTQKPRPPIRPSREGASNITTMHSVSPVVQSDLPRLYTSYHKRTPSQETPVYATSPSPKTRFGFSSRSSSRNESPRIDSAISPPPSARHFHRGPTPDLPMSQGKRQQRKDSPAVSGSSPAKLPRFGFFHRKPKVDATKATEKPKRQPSKGPSAGTGHEGYGRFGVRGRSGSTSSSTGISSPNAESVSSSAPRPTPPKRKSTTTSSKDGLELDAFLRERLNPVVLRGSGSTVSNTASSFDLPNDSLHPASSKSSSLDSYPQPRLLPSAMDSSESVSPAKRAPLGRRKQSDSSDDDVNARYPNLATRRSLTRLSSAGSRSPVRVPAPIITNISRQHTSIDSYDAETSAWPQTDSSLPPTKDAFHGQEGLWLRSPQEPTVKPIRKWNFFQRATASPRPKDKGTAVAQAEVPEVTAHQSPYRSVAHYAMLGPMEPVGLEEVERIAWENETSQDDSMSESNGPSRIVPYERRHNSLLPSPPKQEYGSDSDFHAKPVLPKIMVQRQDSTKTPDILHARPAFPNHTAHVADIPRSPNVSPYFPFTASPAQAPALSRAVTTPEPSQGPLDTSEPGDDSPRHPRLSPVGRIPAVVSRRDRDRKLSDTSFSRPFARSQLRSSVRPPGSIYSQIREMASPIESGSQPVSSTSTRSDANSADPKSSTYTNPSISTNRTSMEIHASNEFFTFPRKNSEQSSRSYRSYSSSSGNPSWMAASYTQPPQQEDVWNEYNDLLDEVMPLKTPTTGSSLGAPFQYSSMLYDGNSASFPTPLGQPPSTRLPPPPEASILPSVLSVPQQISRFLQPSMSPMAADTVSRLIGGYGNRSTSTLFTQDRNSMQQPSRTSIASARGSVASSHLSRGSGHSRSASLPDANIPSSQGSVTPNARYLRDAQLADISEMPNGTLSIATTLRFGALMTSKWLSFGRVLSSPAHNEMQLASEPRILVIDGLSSDWSYYVALSYPTAAVYNLTPSMPGSPSFTWPAANEKPPPNHRQIPLASISASFPFPRGFFTTVVFRFPAATTEHAYTACISECKRVLRPGGYLETAVLDLDLVNMGSKAKKAVRGLKTRMQQRDPEVCLRNLSDILVRLIGRRGFESVQRCVVGVPAAGRIPRSQDMSSISSDTSGKPAWQREVQPSKSQEFSFADLLEDARSNQFGIGKSNDESITNMVAKVGRWWYSECYEKALLPADQSIWRDDALLRECEKQGTSFRLLICHAQKPTQTRRRTVSV